YSSLTERNFNAFISQRFGKKGYTFFAGLTNQNAVDVNKDGFSDVPDIQYVTLHPKFYYYPDDNSRLVVGISGLYEKRMGGDMQVLHEQADATHTFFEKNESWRSSVDLVYDHTSQGGNIFTVKSTAGQYDRTSTTNTWIFGGTQYNSFSEVSYFIPKKNYDLVLGANFVTDLFQTTRSSGSLIHEVKNTTAGAFIQHTLRIGKKLVLETGLRVDEHNNYGTFILPRIAFLYKIDSVFSSRLNGGLGYKTPNPFAKEFQDYDPNTINPVADPVKAEHSAGGGFDLVCDKKFNNGLHLFADQSFFYTTINAPVIPQTNPYNEIYFVNAGKPVTTAGSDTYVRLATEELELYFGYTYTHARQHYDTLQKVMPLYPAHRFATVFVYELGERWRAGVESSWFGSQFTPGGEKKPGYLFMALMVAHSLGKINLVLNCENLLDYRQSKVEQLVDPPNTNPVFKTLWAPIDGRVVNLSARFKF
ncbi:MAG TPA: TonB-dependent receptor, partial [Bacteroidia bacterium]